MNRKIAEKVTIEYMKPIYGFALKRCANTQDAEDLTQDICLKLFRSMLVHDDIEEIKKFVWTVAHNALSNYYRKKQIVGIGICIDDLAEILPSDDDVSKNIILLETENKLHCEISYLSKMQRQVVVMYYYENKKQDEIARLLSIPIGTIKWHLFEAKSELKKGMETMRNLNELKFSPIKFELCGTNGSIGTKGGNPNFFRSILSQNIAYCTWKEGKTINEIAEALGVSPVYIESEVEYLEEYCFLIKKGNKYLANILIDETTTEINKLQSEIYDKVANLFANDLYDELMQSGILDNEMLYYPDNDKNFALWSLLPYIAALSGEKLKDNAISFEEAMTRRPDGGQNIAYASVLSPDVIPSKYFNSLKQWCGPCWNTGEHLILWQNDSEWSVKRVDDNYQIAVKRDLGLLDRFITGDCLLSPDEYAYMSEKGFIKTDGDPDGLFKATLKIVWIRDDETKQKLIGIGDKLKEKYRDKFNELKAPLFKIIMDDTPNHLRKTQAFGLQFMFYSDGWFLLHCIKELIENGKLKPPTEDQKKSLTTIIVPK